MNDKDKETFEKYFIDQWELIGVKPGHLLDETKVKLSSELSFKYEVQKFAWQAAIYYERKTSNSKATPEASKIASISDEQAFDNWFRDYWSFELINNQDCLNSWIAGCEHKNQEVVFYKSQLEVAEKILTEVQADKWTMREQINRLREALEFYAVNGLAKVEVGQKIDERLAREFYVNGSYAREALKKTKTK